MTGNYFVTADKLGHFKFSCLNFNNEIEEEEITKNPREGGHKDSVKDIAFSPSDAKFITCSTDKTLKVWDTFELKCETNLTGHGSDVLAADWHPWMKMIASGGKDRFLKIWTLGERQANVCSLYHHTNSINCIR